LAHSGAARQRFARESRAAAAVVHEHVVAIHDVDTDGKTPYLVMQYVAGESLQARVDRDGPLLVKEVLRIGAQTAAGLHAAHSQGVVHRDIKPANILLERGIERVLVTDFGLARTVDDASLTHTGVIAGTPHYMSPEQALGQATDLRTDLFSLGAVLYFMATGHAPFRAEKAMGVLNRICHEPHRPVWEVNPDVPDELSDIIDRLLSKKVSRRYASAIEVHQQLNHTLASLQQPRPLAFRKTKRWLRQYARPLMAIAASLLVVSAVGLYLLVSGGVSSSGLSASAGDGEAVHSQLSPLAPPAAAVAAAEKGNESPRSFSLEVWQMALTDDPQVWRTQVEQLSRDLERSSPSSFEFFLPPSSSPMFEQTWQNELDAVHRQIDSLRGSSPGVIGDDFHTPPRP
jgi:serine/threonine protein kinase